MHPPDPIDAHVHVWDWQLAEYDWLTPEMEAIRRSFRADDLRPLLSAHGIRGAVLVQTCSSLQETREYLELAATDEAILGVVGWVDLTDPAVGDTLDELVARPDGAWLKGIRHQVHDEADPAWLDRADVRRGIRAVGTRGLAYDVLVRERELPAALRLARDVEEGPLIIDHLAKPAIRDGALEQWSRDIASLARLEQVRCKLSGMVTEADWDRWTVADVRPFGERVIECFGADRLLYGSDWPVCTLAADYDAVFSLAEELTRSLSRDEQAQVFAGTAASAYQLSTSEAVP